MQRSIPFSDLQLTQKHVLNAMGYNGHTPDDGILQLVESTITEAAHHCHPLYSVVMLDGELKDDQLTVNETVLNVGKIIARGLKGSRRFALFTASAGEAFQHWTEEIEEDDILMKFVADSLGSEIAEAVAEALQQDLAARGEAMQLSITNRFSPGYCGWSVAEQHLLFPLLGNERSGITLSESGLMYPIKSVSGIIGMGKSVRLYPYTCALCDFKDCFRRRKAR